MILKFNLLVPRIDNLRIAKFNTVMITILITVLCYGVMSCKAITEGEGIAGSNNKQKNQTAVAKTAPAQLDSPLARKAISAKSPTQEPVQILIPDWYRTYNGLPVIDPKEKWQELYFDSTQKYWKSGPAQLKTRMIYEECSGDSALVISSGHESLLLFTGIKGVLPRVGTVTVNELLFPGHDLTFVVNGSQYKISASSCCFDDKGQEISRETLQNTPQNALMDACKQLNYRVTVMREEESPFEIFHMDSLEFTNPTLIWLGDLNNDGLPDLLLDIPQFKESSMYYLYLSDADDPAMPIKFAAEIFIQRDC